MLKKKQLSGGHRRAQSWEKLVLWVRQGGGRKERQSARVGADGGEGHRRNWPTLMLS